MEGFGSGERDAANTNQPTFIIVGPYEIHFIFSQIKITSVRKKWPSTTEIK